MAWFMVLAKVISSGKHVLRYSSVASKVYVKRYPAKKPRGVQVPNSLHGANPRAEACDRAASIWLRVIVINIINKEEIR